MRNPPARPPGGRLAPCLRIASHNTDGLRPPRGLTPTGAFRGYEKLHALLTAWHNLRLQVVCLQETKIRASDTEGKLIIQQRLDAAAAAWGLTRYTVVHWGSNEQASSAGVAVLVRTDLLTDKTVTTSHPQSDPDGRLMHLKLVWGGHKLRLINAYLPSGNAPLQQHFVKSRLTPLIKAVGPTEQILLLGDFNFTVDWTVDRTRRPPTPPTPTHPQVLPTPPPSPLPPLPLPSPPLSHPPSPSAQPPTPLLHPGANTSPLPARPQWHRDQAPARAMRDLCSAVDLTDAFRFLHPHRPSFTHIDHYGAARLDRIYLSEGLLTHLEQCNASQLSASDHRPVVLHIRRRKAQAAPRRESLSTNRVKMTFWSDPDLAKRFTDWVLSEVASAPTASDSDLLAWWPAFKQRTTTTIRNLHKQFQLQRGKPSEALQTAQAELDLAHRDLDVAATAAAAIPQVITAHRHFKQALRATALDAERAARYEWLRDGERPGPIISKLMSPPASSRHIVALRSSTGGLLTDGKELAESTAAYFAAISATQPQDQEAEQQILRAVRAHATQISPADAEIIGSPVVTAEEVLAAIKATKPGRAPGPDGLPTELWRKVRTLIAPLLASIFTAIGRTGALPDDFLLGELNPFHKKGDPTNHAHYRPITLLDTDYRILARVLASRLAPVLAKVMGAEQSAFLPGRLIGDNIMFMQLLPHLLCSNVGSGLASSAAVAFLDFKKAYDTVLRPFLLAVMDATGAGPGLQHWVRTLLSDTRAAAKVNGYLSDPALYEEGLRQGCPLAPLLYLFIGWALSCWLRECPVIGIKVTPEHPIHCLQYADDAWALLRDLSPASVQTFIDAMSTFARASNQHLNVDKSELMAVGYTSSMGDIPPTVCSIKVVQKVQSLGVTYSNCNAPTHSPDWEAMLDTAHTGFIKLSKTAISMFGRAAAASSYCISKLLFQGEFGDMPDSVAAELQRLTSALVDRNTVPPRRHLPPTQERQEDPETDVEDETPPEPNLLPTPLLTQVGTAPPPLATQPAGHPPPPPQGPRTGQRPPGVESRLLVGKPALGGFGVMPWQQHISARHATWAARLITAVSDENQWTPETPTISPPWISLAARLLANIFPNTHPALAMLRASHDKLPSGASVPSGTASKMGPLARLANGLNAMGRIAEVAKDGRLLPGPWCQSAPLWANPLLGELEACDPFAALATLPDLRTLGDLQRLRHQPGGDSAALTRLWEAIPASWRRALPAPTAAPADWTPTVATIVNRLGWGIGSRTQLLLSKITVRSATQLQLGNLRRDRHRHALRYATSALQGNPDPTKTAATATSALLTNMAALWRTTWEPRHKEPFWRLVNHGISGAGGHNNPSSLPCVCGWHPPARGAPGDTSLRAAAADAWRQHAFWDCPIALAVRKEINSSLPHPSPPVNCDQVWLLTPPPAPPGSTSLHPGVWRITAAAAVAAMEYGRRNMHALQREHLRDPNKTQTVITAFFSNGNGAISALYKGRDTILRASKKAAAEFWNYLQDFADLNQQPPTAWTDVAPDHPFLGVSAGSLRLNLAPGLTLPDNILG